MDEGTIAKWHKKEGDFVEAGEILLEITTDKATIEHATLDEGYLRKILLPQGKTATVNDPIAIFTETKDESIEGYMPKKTTAQKKEEVAAMPTQKQPSFTPEPTAQAAPAPVAEKKVVASPLAKKLAKEKGLDLLSVKGTGPGGRITSRDLKRAQPLGVVSFGPSSAPSQPSGAYKEEELSPVRKVLAQRLQESKSYIPHFYVKQTIDAAPLVEMRAQLKNLNLNVTFNDMIIRACALALRNHPDVNSGFNSQNQTILRFETIDIAVAVSFKEGLITPIIRHADCKNLGDISQEIKLLVDKARKNKLTEEEYKGGSFTISNLGMHGISEFSAIINPPQAAILAIGGIEEKPTVKEGHVVAGKTLTLVLSCDHRVIDGVAGSLFLKTLQQLLENPVSLTV